MGLLLRDMHPKKQYGQHFLKEPHVAVRIAGSLRQVGNMAAVLEIGAGRGALTRPLLERYGPKIHVLELDADMFPLLRGLSGLASENIHTGDALKCNWNQLLPAPYVVVGNFPYNISTQLMWKMIEHRSQAMQMCGIFQREVAQRIVAPPGSKVYGLISVVVQAFYRTEYLFALSPGHFNPPPTVHSAVIRLERRTPRTLPCDERVFFALVKAAFGQRRKILRNSLQAFVQQASDELPQEVWALLAQRPEQMAVADFILLSQRLRPHSDRQ